MEKTTLHENIVIDNSDVDKFSESYWYRQFDELSAQAPGFTRKDLIPFDRDFDLAKALNYIRNIRNKKAGLKTLVKVCNALEKLIESKQSVAA